MCNTDRMNLRKKTAKKAISSNKKSFKSIYHKKKDASQFEVHFFSYTRKWCVLKW